MVASVRSEDDSFPLVNGTISDALARQDSLQATSSPHVELLSLPSVRQPFGEGERRFGFRLTILIIFEESPQSVKVV